MRETTTTKRGFSPLSPRLLNLLLLIVMAVVLIMILAVILVQVAVSTHAPMSYSLAGM